MVLLGCTYIKEVKETLNTPFTCECHGGIILKCRDKVGDIIIIDNDEDVVKVYGI